MSSPEGTSLSWLSSFVWEIFSPSLKSSSETSEIYRSVGIMVGAEKTCSAYGWKVIQIGRQKKQT
ncbi:unnamed protein product [Acanthoscelides obtectus]|uniref:Uncharacterized protein n=1 Tax=Acanthoscelides obtectus TaxID=200917 RepID=A0A9P0L880_ACAOB|nr:unnamed protein product [Acanthoscelides obtectus]CAK1636435.1 hypothetical protein AOBTE_LOCUS9849 [Acanthoscelides obtectus]